MTRPTTAALTLERPLVLHPVEHASECLHGLVDVISGVHDARHPTGVEQLDTLEHQPQVEQSIQPPMSALFERFGRDTRGHAHVVAILIRYGLTDLEVEDRAF